MDTVRCGLLNLNSKTETQKSQLKTQRLNLEQQDPNKQEQTSRHDQESRRTRIGTQEQEKHKNKKF